MTVVIVLFQWVVLERGWVSKEVLSWPCVRDHLEDTRVPALLQLDGQIHWAPAVCCPVSVSFVWVGR